MHLTWRFWAVQLAIQMQLLNHSSFSNNKPTQVALNFQQQSNGALLFLRAEMKQ